MGVYAAQNGETSCTFNTKATFETLLNGSANAFCLFNEYTAVNLDDDEVAAFSRVPLLKLDITSANRETKLHAGIIILYTLAIVFFVSAVGIFSCTVLNTKVVSALTRAGAGTRKVFGGCTHAMHHAN